MAEFKHENPQLKFTVPDAITVRQQLEFYGIATLMPDREMYLRLWEAAKPLIQEWECPSIPDYTVFDLDKSDSPDAAQAIVLAGLDVRTHLAKLEKLEKN